MRYAYKDLGEQPAGTEITVQLKGSAANVLLLDRHNYSRYKASRGFRYSGGFFARSPARVTVPRDGRWHLVIDCGGYRGRVLGQIVQISPPQSLRSSSSKEEEAETVEAVS